ncbi:MAG: 30S ribosomal protein S16 [Verrucomicrobia bacterium]|nr:30S ribosomal protein S16 [Verrucomicrobiota bacterium]MBU4290344.1 30S ribosomal protein S16 [Verrucomicrobiota bacterium]MBU4428306.1 30S ribosomal protein S16 [Verrucomicrobiota bacterium]MCG2681474.1 30S ribosomal protein S16 [Kiritimatiellia bacterium]
MSVKIRCQKTGANNDPCFRIVATDIRSPRDGKSLETLGWYDPKKKDKNFFLQLDRIEIWKKQGAQISDMVRTLIRKAKTGAMAIPPAAVPASTATQPALEA